MDARNLPNIDSHSDSQHHAAPQQVSPEPALKPGDLLWVLGYPVYQLVGTIRHEAGHALVAALEGAHIKSFVWWPTLKADSGIRWGYVAWDGKTTWVAIAGPYLLDLLTFGVAYSLCTRRFIKRRWLWTNVVILGIASPLINSAYNYWGGFHNPNNDVGRLLHALPPLAVHSYFVVTLLLYLIGLLAVWAYAPPHRPNNDTT